VKYVSPNDLACTPLEGVYPHGFCTIPARETQPASYVPRYRAIPGSVDEFCRMHTSELSDSQKAPLRREPSLHELWLQSVIHWKRF
jgi:hypothetical protein